MSMKTSHKLLASILGLMLVIAPMQAAVSAIDMLDMGTGQSQHCPSAGMDMPMDETAGHDGNHNGCCSAADNACQDNCSSCSSCVSVYSSLTTANTLSNFSTHKFIPQQMIFFEGISPGGEGHPPRNVS
ncbi:MAG: hypothetical protein OEZ33_06910 [Gammaproteobacteria bacterium]|nr:hypothetical protein [Gammaproteobacteria bacterium]MDH5777922.1 hypothetical protein [Gammaproteobacteria bacterium]